MFQAEGTTSAGALRGEYAYKGEGQYVSRNLGGPKRGSKARVPTGLRGPVRTLGFILRMERH